MTERYSIELSADEALVLEALLEPLDGVGQIQVSDLAEVAAVWALSAALEKQLPALFQSDYGQQLEAARMRLRARFAADAT